MLERAAELEWPIIKTADKCGFSDEYKLTTREFLVIRQVADVLKPIDVALAELCKRNATLLTADASFQFMIDQLKEKNTVWGEKLLDRLRIRLNSRRTKYSGVLHYLNSAAITESNAHSTVEFEEDNFFCPPTRVDVSTLILKLLTTVVTKTVILEDPPEFNTTESQIDEMMITEDSSSGTTRDSSIIDDGVDDEVVVVHSECLPNAVDEPENAELSWAQKLQKYLDKVTNAAKTRTQVNGLQLLSSIKSEMVKFETEGVRGPYLSQAYELLLSIKPTSVESERTFSAAALTVTKIRSSLGDNTIDAISFLKAYFRQIREEKKSGKT